MVECRVSYGNCFSSGPVSSVECSSFWCSSKNKKRKKTSEVSSVECFFVDRSKKKHSVTQLKRVASVCVECRKVSSACECLRMSSVECLECRVSAMYLGILVECFLFLVSCFLTELIPESRFE